MQMTTDPRAYEVAQDFDAEIPEIFIRPISLHLMRDPVRCGIEGTAGNETFDRTAIVSWLVNSPTYPITREPLSGDDLIVNNTLKIEIQAWRRMHKLII